MTRFVSALLFAIVALGCANPNARVPLSGAVTYKGKPIPRGTIMFDPDESKGNMSGYQGSADIVDGRYATLNDFGPQKGAYVARISGYDGKATPELPLGEALFTEARIPVVIESGQPLDLAVPATN